MGRILNRVKNIQYYEEITKGEFIMKVNTDLLKKGLGVLSVIAAGAVAVANAISDQKKEAEFEGMKKAIEELQNN